MISISLTDKETEMVDLFFEFQKEKEYIKWFRKDYDYENFKVIDLTVTDQA